MRDNRMLYQALRICVQAHGLQQDKAGEPYALHPIVVMSMVDSVEEKIVALLHDVVEDTKWTQKDIENEKFSDEVKIAVKAITKLPGEKYQKYLDRVKDNALATTVKIADLIHNSDITRLPTRTEADMIRLAKYVNALLFLRR